MPIELSPEEKQKISNRLQERGALLPCPRCGNQSFTLLDGYINHPLQNKVSAGLILGGPIVPTIGVVCTRCGFLAEHAIGILGLMPPTEQTSAPAAKAEGADHGK